MLSDVTGINFFSVHIRHQSIDCSITSDDDKVFVPLVLTMSERLYPECEIHKYCRWLYEYLGCYPN